MRATLCLVLLSMSCSVDLAVDDSTLLLCDEDGDCPEGFCAASGRCVAALDDTELRLEAAVATSLTTVELRFDDELDGSGDPAMYAVAPPLSVIAADLSGDRRSVVLTTSPQALDVIYVVSVTELADDQGNGVAAEASSAAFVSFLGQRSLQPPRFTSPVEDTTVRVSPVRLAWTSIAGAVSYSIDVATDPAFTTELQTFTVSTLSLDVDAPRDVTYYARIRADFTAPGVYGATRFQRLNGAIYVACASDPCGSGGQGTRASPFASINQALAVATVENASEIRIAGRPGGIAYDEAISITGRGIRLRGGFAPSFSDDIPNPATYPTRLSAVGTVVAVTEIADAGGDVQLEDLEIIADGQRSLGVLVRDTQGVVLERVSVLAGAALVTRLTARAVRVDGARDDSTTRITIRDSVLTALEASEVTRALEVDRAGLTLQGATLSAEDSQSSVALEATRLADSEIDATSITAAGTSTGATAASIGAPSDAEVGAIYIHDSSFYASSSGITSSSGLDLATAQAVVERVRVEVQGSSLPVGMALGNTRPTTVRNVAVLVSGGGTLGAALAIVSIPSVPEAAPNPVIADSTFVNMSGFAVRSNDPGTSLANNLLVGTTCVLESPAAYMASVVGCAFACGTLYSAYSPSGQQVLTNINDVNALNGVSDRRTSGNVASSAAAADLFVSVGVVGFDDLHLKASAPAAIRNGGTDARLAACGPASISPVVCGGDGTDGDTNPRASGFSFGYDEL